MIILYVEREISNQGRVMLMGRNGSRDKFMLKERGNLYKKGGKG